MATKERLTQLFDTIFYPQVTQHRAESNQLIAALATVGSHVDLDATPTTDPHDRGAIWLDGDLLKVSAG